MHTGIKSTIVYLGSSELRIAALVPSAVIAAMPRGRAVHIRLRDASMYVPVQKYKRAFLWSR